MSMFYELMMRKKTQIMYATIKGSLTENDGVFSGFSASNYLLTQDNIAINTNQNFEIRVTFTTGGDVSSFKHLLETYGHPYDFYIDFKDDRFRFRFFDANNTSVIYTLWYSITTNTQYTVIWQYISATNTHNISLVQNGVVVASFSNTSTIYSYNYPFAIGCSDIVGSIDLNKSYIKIDNTKYKLQAVVGYTVVGSPTISDGVVSGFSSSDYLRTAQNFPSVSGINKVQEQVVFATGTIETQQMIMGGDYGAGIFGFELRTNGKLMFRVSYVDVGGTIRYAEAQTDTILTANTQYKAVGNFDINNLVVNIKLYDENNVLLDDNNYTIPAEVFSSLVAVGSFYFGRHWQRGVFTGSINLNNNNTYIKINNKLWFNGQQS